MNQRLVGQTGFERLQSVMDMPRFQDCTFLIGPDKVVVKACSVLLAIVSPYFEACFHDNWSNGKPVEMRDEEPNTFRRFLELSLMTLGHSVPSNFEIFTCREEAKVVCELAHRFLVWDLLEPCMKYLAPKCFDDFFEVFEWAENYNFTSLCSACLEYFSENVLIITDKRFLELKPKFLEKIFNLDYMNIYSELEIFNAAMKWAARVCRKLSMSSDDPINLRNILEGENILKHIRFLSLTPEEFENGPRMSGIFTKKESETILSHIHEKSCSCYLANIVSQKSSSCYLANIASQKRTRRMEPQKSHLPEGVEYDALNYYVVKTHTKIHDTKEIYEYSARYAVLLDVPLMILGVTLKTKFKDCCPHGVSCDAYEEDIKVKLVDSNGDSKGEGHYKGKVRYNAAVYVHIKLRNPMLFVKGEIITFIVQYSTNSDCVLFKKQVEGSPKLQLRSRGSTITKIHYCVFNSMEAMEL